VGFQRELTIFRTTKPVETWRRVLLISGLMASAAPVALAQSATTARVAPDTDTTVAELVITAAAAQSGAVVGDVVPELQLDPADIQAYGVSTMAELLGQLSAQTRSVRGLGGAPVILLNGRRISGFTEIRDLPTEAILRVDILPEEAALKYGFAASQRVVNFVLKPEFRASTAELSGGAPTAGGRRSGQAELGFFSIKNDRRFNVDLKVESSTALTEDERNLVPLTAGRAFDLAGNVSGAGAGGEIDPGLSRLAGRTVTLAGVPATAASRTPSLTDFVATAGTPNVTNTGRFRTLLPATDQVTANVVYSRPVAGGVLATLNATLEATRSDSLKGLPGISLLIPAGHPVSPFSTPVILDRYTTALGPLAQSRDSWSGRLGGGLNRDLANWRLSLTGAYEHQDTRTDSDTGINALALQALVTARAPGFNPFGALPAEQLSSRENATRSKSDNAEIQGLASGRLFSIPAGAVRTSLRLGAERIAFNSTSERLGVAQSVDLSRNAFTGQVNLDVPLASRRAGFLAGLGELSANGNLALEDLSDAGSLLTVGYGLNWRPINTFSLILSASHDEDAATIQQLGNPLVLTPGVRIFDFATGRTVDVTLISGGNAGLSSETADTLKIGLNYSPFTKRDLVFSANYVDTRTDNPIVTFPAATADIEAAFPERFQRDAAGNLVQVDYRPVNFARQDRRNLRWGFNYTQPVGPQPVPPRGRPGGSGRPGGAPPGGMSGGPPSFAAGGPPPSAFGGGGSPRGGPVGTGGRLQASVYHTVVLEDRYLVRRGGPVLDQLNGAAADGSGGGQSRHEVEAELGVSAKGLGARFTANWKSGTSVDAGPSSPTGSLQFSDLTRINLRLFADLDQQKPLIDRAPWLKGSRVSLSLNNLFDERIKVRDATGATPIGYQPANLDPVGRTIRFSFRKLFL
jgi:hypothetical protein